MQLCGREFNVALIDRIAKVLEAEPGLSRRALSRRVCEWLEWRAANGSWKEVSCRKALLELHRRQRIRLPAAQPGCFQRSRRRKGKERGLEVAEVQGSLAELGEIQIVAISSRYSRLSRIWNELMERFHYLGKGPLCGAQIRYLVKSSRYGWVGALAFSAGQWRLKERDQYIGWTEAARRANLPRVVGNSRFLILPSVRVPHLASHVLGLCLRRLGKDWRERYGYAPRLVETFVDRSRFRGTSYQAANWRRVGQTVARPTAYANGKMATGPKEIYVYPLGRGWKKELCTEPPVVLGSQPGPEAPVDWREEEFGRVRFFDERLKERLYRLAADFWAEPGELIPQACHGSAARTKAAYRFFGNRQVDMQTLLRPHVESTLERLRAQPVVLAPQDSTTLNYTAHPPEGAGPINTRGDAAVGLIVHDTLALTPEGTPLGVLNVQCWGRDPAQAGQKYRRQQRPIEEKESRKWLVSYRAVAEVQKLCPETMLVSMGDREADLYELFHEATQDPAGPKLLVRAERTRQRRVEQQKKLWPKMRGLPVAGWIEVAVPRRAARPARQARLQVRFAAVELRPPCRSALPPLRVWAVYAREVNHGRKVKEPLEWMLLTTLPTDRFSQACQWLRWYARRWGIEVYHRILKSGCRIEDRRLQDTDSLESCLAIDMVIGWRVYWMTMVGREQPNLSCDQILREEEWQALGAWATGQIPDRAPTAQQAMRWIGKLGGWLTRSPQDNPGPTCLWRGLARLPILAQGYLLPRRLPGVRAGP